MKIRPGMMNTKCSCCAKLAKDGCSGSRKVVPWCDDAVKLFLPWATRSFADGQEFQPEGVPLALRTALSMMLMPSSFSRRDYVLFKLGEDRKEEVAEFGLDKVVDVCWWWDFVCVRPQKIEMLVGETG